MIIVSCPDCGKPLLWHLAHEHRCDKQPQKSKPQRKPTTAPVMKTEPSRNSSPSNRRIDTPPKRVDTVDTPVDTPPVSTQGTRLQRWRAKNREAYNASMRAWRARQKAPE